MADFMYDLGRQGFLDGSIDWDTDTIKAVLVTSGYTANQATDQFHSAIGGGNIVATSGALSSKTVASGVADAADFTFTALSGSAVTQIIYFKDTGSSATSRLIAKVDSYAGLPYTPTGADLTIVLPNDANKLFKL